MKRAWTLGLLVTMSAFLPANRADAQTSCDGLKKAFEEARADYERARKSYDDAWHAYLTKSMEVRQLEKLQEMQAKLSKAKEEVEKWNSKGEPSVAKEHQIEVDYWTKEISAYQAVHPDAGPLDTLEARVQEMRQELKVREEARYAAFRTSEAARERYEKASLAYQACHPDEHAKVPPGTCESARKRAEDLDAKRHRLSGPGKDIDEFNKADDAYGVAHKEYCQCLWDRGVRPLPWECAYYEPHEPLTFKIESGYNLPKTPPPPPSRIPSPPPSGKTVAPPPPAKSIAPVTPPPPVATVVPPSSPKTSTPPAPPSPKTPPPPPPPPTTVTPPPPKTPAPPTGSAPPPASSTYVCGKTPCDCAKQSPPKKCTTSSGCVCTKG